jgi:hypothetical protein
VAAVTFSITSSPTVDCYAGGIVQDRSGGRDSRRGRWNYASASGVHAQATGQLGKFRALTNAGESDRPYGVLD